MSRHLEHKANGAASAHRGFACVCMKQYMRALRAVQSASNSSAALMLHVVLQWDDVRRYQ